MIKKLIYCTIYMNFARRWLKRYIVLKILIEIAKPDNWLPFKLTVTLHNTIIHSTQYNTWPLECVFLKQLIDNFISR